MDNIRFNIAAFMLLALLGSVAAIRRAPSVSRNRLFFLCCAINIIFISADAARLLAKNSQKTVEAFPFILPLLSAITAMSLILCAAFFTGYFYTVVHGRISLPRQQFLIFAPAVLSVILLAVNKFKPLLFYLTEDGSFKQLPLFFAIIAYYLAYISILTARAWEIMTKKDRPIVVFLISISVLSILTQIVFPSVHVTNLVLPLVALLAYQTIESTSNYIDIKTELQNETAFYSASATLIRAKAKWECLLVILDNIPAMDNEFDSALTDGFLSLAAKFLSKISKKISVMHVKRNMFALCYKETNELEGDRVRSLIEKRFSSPFTIGNINIVHTFCCCRISYPEHYSSYEDFCSFIELAAFPYNRPAKKQISASDLDINSLKRKKLILSLLQTALADESIKITYQPTFNSSTKKAESIETEYYIKDRSIGLAYSKELMEAAEELGLAKQIFLYTYHSVCGTIQKARLIDHKVSFVELPLPLSELTKNDAEKTICEIADIYFIPHSMIRFILSDTALASYSPLVLRKIHKIQEQGFSFTFEDLGNTHVNIQMLMNANLAEATVIMPSLEHGEQQGKITQSMNTLIEAFKKYNTQVKAKKISTNSQNIAAQLYAVEMLQGDFYSPPLTQEGLVKFFSLEALNA
ncbi:MAG: EAL domain-containing protein [Treponema sp.]|nr:EAL domain-containing protein [Treponema sp.]